MAAHGTTLRYRAGCRCSCCVICEADRNNETRRHARAANARRITATRPRRHGHLQVASHTLRTGELAVECWCQDRIVYVMPELVKAGRTGSCGAPGCTAALVAS